MSDYELTPLGALVPLLGEKPDDDDVRRVARVLERKAERMRAREERGVFLLPRCFCGERREGKALVCAECFVELPAELMLAFHLGTSGQRRQALQRIRVVCETRARGEEVAG